MPNMIGPTNRIEQPQIKYDVVVVEAGLSVYVVGGQGVRLFVVVVSCGVLDVFLLGGFLSRHVCDLC